MKECVSHQNERVYDCIHNLSGPCDEILGSQLKGALHYRGMSRVFKFQ